MRIRTVAIAASILLSVTADAQWLPDPPTESGPIYYNGRVGIGTSSPSAPLHVVGTGTVLPGALLEDFNKNINLGYGVVSVVDLTLPTPQYWTVGGNISLRGVYTSGGATAGFGGIKAGKANNTDGNLDSFVALYTRGNSTGITEKLRIDESGRVGIGTTAPTAKLHVVGGDILVTGGNITGAKVIGAVYQDLAEWVPSSDDLAPGTVVILDKRSGNTVTASRKAYDTLVAGVVSKQPGIILGEASATKEQIATTGRVKVRVDATSGRVEIGDLLVTSDVSGTAMKSAPIDIGGFSIHRPGTIIGKALEPLDRGVGEILVLLSLQ